jgi:hypothetical protein
MAPNVRVKEKERRDMGSLFSPDIPAPPPPPPPSTIRDEVNGVEQVPVTNPDGSKTFVTRAIPLTPEQKAEQEELDRIKKEALAEIEKLSSADFQDNEETQEVLDAWQEERKRLLDKEFSQRTREEEKVLARRGLSDSTASQNIRRRRQLDEQEAEQQLQNERKLLSDDVRRQAIGLQQNLFNIAASQQDSKLVRQQQSAISGQNSLVAANSARQASIADFYRAQLQRSRQPSVFGLFGQAVAGSVGAAFGAPLGGFFANSIFNKRG